MTKFTNHKNPIVMKQFVYFFILTLLLGACGTGKQVAFQDDAYDNTRETKVYASAEVEQKAEGDLYADEYYLEEAPQVVNNYYNCNCGGGFYDPWRNNSWNNCNNRFGLSMGYGWGNYYYPYNSWSTWGNPYSYYDPFYGYSYYNYGWGYNPYSYNYYGSQYSSNWGSTETGSSSVVYAPRGSVSSTHRGNPNTMGTNNPTYTKSYYSKRADAVNKSSSTSTSTDINRRSLNPESTTRNTTSVSRTYKTSSTSSSSSSSYSRGGTTTRSTNTNSSYQRSSTPTYNSSTSRSGSASPSTPTRSNSGTSSSTSSTTRRRP